MSSLTDEFARALPTPRVAFVIATLGFGGAQRALTNMLNRWCTRRSLTPSLIVLERQSAPAYPLAPEISVRWLDVTGVSTSSVAKITNNLRRIRLIRNALRDVGPDVVVAFQDVTNVLVLLACAGTGLPVAVCERVHPAQHDIGAMWNVLRRLTYPFADAIVVQGHSIARWFPGSVQEHIRVIPNSVPKPAATTAAPKASARRTLLAVGRLHHQKGFDLLLNAFAKVAGSHPDWDLVILGEGPEREPLAAQTTSLGLNGRVCLAGTVSPIAAKYDEADIFVLPSRFEGFPNALAEAMAHGLPVLAADSPGAVRDLVTHNVNGLLTPAEDAESLADALDLLMASPLERQRLGEAARAVTETFDENRILAQWERMLLELRGGTPCT
jgi:glycosyltransferase involved in cell wall biosynthesis